ncbi:uncharacterized protein LOC62_04G005353 [Vanrija pseudolonga]|uniref:Uncharacterized protein n=1 Tax=Vanrija pseudolonga TaxID=143232 RepID=A0AAF0Y857_9TREE|nr:hypothetical protein LOC62_04G005353 [Vanrija pseudolonga]
MPIVIDHTAHPHIIDAIIGACDTPTAIAFRSTSRAFRDKIDPMLLAHVLLYAPAPDPVPSIQHLNRIKGLVRPSEVVDPEVEGAPPPPLLPFVPGAIRAIDVNTENEYTPEFARKLTGVRTVRRSNDAVWSTPPPFDGITMVDFVSLYGGLYQDLGPFWFLETYVIHIRWDESERQEIFAEIDATPMKQACMSLMVLVLEPWSPGRPPVCTPDLTFLSNIAVGMLSVLEWGGTLCIVGADDVSPLNMGAEADDEDEDDAHPVTMFEDMLLGFWRDSENAPPEDHLVRLLADVEFVSLAEWHESLRQRGRDEDGLDVYELLAEWPRYARP